MVATGCALNRSIGAAPSAKAEWRRHDCDARMAAKLPVGIGFEWTEQCCEERLSGSHATMPFAWCAKGKTDSPYPSVN